MWARLLDRALMVTSTYSVCSKALLFTYVSMELSEVWVRLAWNWVGELSAEMVGYFGRFGVGSVVECDGLVWVLVGAFTGKIIENFRVFACVAAC